MASTCKACNGKAPLDKISDHVAKCQTSTSRGIPRSRSGTSRANRRPFGPGDSRRMDLALRDFPWAGYTTNVDVQEQRGTAVWMTRALPSERAVTPFLIFSLFFVLHEHDGICHIGQRTAQHLSTFEALWRYEQGTEGNHQASPNGAGGCERGSVGCERSESFARE